jgi:hypothetical protein
VNAPIDALESHAEDHFPSFGPSFSLAVSYEDAAGDVVDCFMGSEDSCWLRVCRLSMDLEGNQDLESPRASAGGVCCGDSELVSPAVCRYS